MVKVKVTAIVTGHVAWPRSFALIGRWPCGDLNTSLWMLTYGPGMTVARLVGQAARIHVSQGFPSLFARTGLCCSCGPGQGDDRFPAATMAGAQGYLAVI